ncbi:hypothetical protein KC320_g55 [Hortaea werneckii]|nr:hypothetical protein KC320_g55 [Hortaea werneckii]
MVREPLKVISRDVLSFAVRICTRDTSAQSRATVATVAGQQDGCAALTGNERHWTGTHYHHNSAAGRAIVTTTRLSARIADRHTQCSSLWEVYLVSDLKARTTVDTPPATSTTLLVPRLEAASDAGNRLHLQEFPLRRTTLHQPAAGVEHWARAVETAF